MIQLPKVYTILPGTPFAKTLAETLWAEYKDDLLGLSDVQIYLPNRRSVQALTDAFLEASDGQAALLPRLTPIGDIDEDDLFETDPFILEDTPDLIPAISSVERHLILTQLVSKRGDVPTIHQAHALAVQLAKLIDRAHTENIDLTKIDTLVTGDLATHWEKTKDFLHIITDFWPKILAERGQCDPARRRNIILQKKPKALLEQQPATRIIAAGSTGSIPATAQFLDAVARMPNGCVILPGFDPSVDDNTWGHIDLQHPYYYMKRLIGIFSIERQAVREWTSPKPHLRQCDLQKLVLQSLQPKDIFDLSNIEVADDCLQGHHFAEAEDPLHEARLIALRLRQVVATEDQTAMVVTPDRLLAKTIQTEMLRWNIVVNDSGGETLDQTPTGIYLRLIAQFPSSATPATSCLTLLRHFFTHLASDNRMSNLSKLEAELRDDILPPGQLATLAQENDSALLREFLDILHLPYQGKKPLKDWLHWHLDVAEKLSRHSTENPSQLWKHDDGNAAAKLFHNLLQSEEIANIELTLPDYEQVITVWMQQITLRPRFGIHPRIRILSPVEARLQNADVTILAGLNDNIWPAPPAPNPWLSRPMLDDMGFEDDDRRIGQSALDFIILFCADHVCVTWSKTRDGVLAHPSRWIQQLSAAMQKAGNPIEPHLSDIAWWMRQWDRPEQIRSLDSPKPKPALTQRPRDFRVTDIEKWQKDPYSFYAKWILRLRPQGLLDRGIDHREWGNVVHDILEQFFTQNGFAKSNPLASFEEIAAEEMKRYDLDPSQRLQWHNRLMRIGRWLVDRNPANTNIPEHTLNHEFRAFDTAFSLQGRADRIDITADGLSITDYKTGTAPSNPKVEKGKSPQLPLLGWMAEKSADPRLKNKKVTELHYMRVTGKNDKPVEPKEIKPAPQMIEANENHLMTLLEKYYVEQSIYTAKILGKRDHDDYIQLKRVAEWAATSFEDDATDNDEEDSE